MIHDLALLEVSRLTRGPSPWERRVHHYDMLLDAGLPHDEALRIAEDVSRAEQQQQAGTWII